MASPDVDTTLIWLRPEPAGRKPRFTREQIARAALKLADHDGFEAVTMKRIAAELGAATMTLYYYVRTKDDIVALMQDTILEDILIPDNELPADWKNALAVISRRSREVLIRHPWAVGSLEQAQFGPNAMRHYEQSLAALDSTGLPPPQKAELTAIVDDYVAGAAAHAVETLERVSKAAHNPEIVKEAAEYGQALIDSGGFPNIQALSVAPQGQGIDLANRLTSQFEVGLAALINGIANHYGIV